MITDSLIVDSTVNTQAIHTIGLVKFLLRLPSQRTPPRPVELNAKDLLFKGWMSPNEHTSCFLSVIGEPYNSKLRIYYICITCYFGGTQSKGFATLRNVSKLTFLGQD